MIDVVYILRNKGTRWRNEEIKYSLRSIEKNIKFNNVFIVGELPRFIDGRKAFLIKADDPYGNKLRNAIHKISLACENKDVSDDFILMNDDFFFLKETDKIEYFNKGKMKNSKKNHSTHGGYYYRAICDTVDLLGRMGIDDPIDFEVHYPIIFNKKKFIDMVSRVNIEDFLFRSVYGNMYGIDSIFRRDIKAFNISQFNSMKNKDMLSIDESMAVNHDVQKFLITTFDKRGECEKVPVKVYCTPVVFYHNGKQYNPGDRIISNDLSEEVIRSNKLKQITVTF